MYQQGHELWLQRLLANIVSGLPCQNYSLIIKLHVVYRYFFLLELLCISFFMVFRAFRRVAAASGNGKKVQS